MGTVEPDGPEPGVGGQPSTLPKGAGAPGRARPAKAPSAPGIRRGGMMQVAATLLWLPQAAALAYAVQAVAAGEGLAGSGIARLDMAHVEWAALLVLVLGVARAGLDAGGSRLAFRSARAALSHMRARAAMALSTRSPLDRDRASSGAAASAIAEQADAIVPYLARYTPARQRASLVPLAILGMILPLSWVAALVLLMAAPLIPLFMALVGWRAKQASAAQMIETGGMNAFLLDRLRGLSTIRALDAVDLTAQRLLANALSVKARTMAVLRIAFLSSAVLELFSALGVAMVAVYIGFHFLGPLGFGAWGGRLSLGEGLFILLLAPAFFQPLRDLSAVWHDRAAGEAALEALQRLAHQGLALPDAAVADPVPADLPADGPSPPPGVSGSRVRFRHAGCEAESLKDFSFAVAPGERIALVGASGAGKSTLLALIAGLAPPLAGEIAIGGIPLDAQTAASLRRRIAWIGQTPHFFAGSLRANIALGRAGIGAAEVERALAFAALERVAHDHAGQIGEGGSGLSGGEALRLALARAAANPDATLILADEPTAHLDVATARDVTNGLLRLAEGRTLIVATHDPALIARMDRAIVLESRP
ncbi:thiol reductant ABC exporter subunit CydD [Roseixanthobacter liquoris]|uniref:thiol reductant ABC exporter subunit CydD n=1 Tax=Roseixanthobacter liquoris TaxID=3119921 RepID=UPI00372D1F1A